MSSPQQRPLASNFNVPEIPPFRRRPSTPSLPPRRPSGSQYTVAEIPPFPGPENQRPPSPPWIPNTSKTAVWVFVISSTLATATLLYYAEQKRLTGVRPPKYLYLPFALTLTLVSAVMCYFAHKALYILKAQGIQSAEGEKNKLALRRLFFHGKMSRR